MTCDEMKRANADADKLQEIRLLFLSEGICGVLVSPEQAVVILLVRLGLHGFLGWSWKVGVFIT